MKNIRKFNEFFSLPQDSDEESPKGDVKFKSFESDELDEFLAYMEENTSKFGRVFWAFLLSKDKNKIYWDQYVKPGCRFSVISDCSVTPCKVLGVVSCDGVVKNCHDQNSRPCKPGDLQEMLSQLGMTEKDL